MYFHIYELIYFIILFQSFLLKKYIYTGLSQKIRIL